MSSKVRNESKQKQNQPRRLNIKLDPRILAALKRESEARGGRQERRIMEEALTVYLSLNVLPQNNGLAGLAQAACRVTSYRKYSRIVE